MKIQHVISSLWIVGCCAVSAQVTTRSTNPTTKATAMNYTLVFITGSKKDIHNPTEADIRAALTSQKDDFGPVFDIHPDGTDEFFAIVSEQDGHFSFQHSPDRKKVIYASKKETFSIDDGVKAASEYLKGSPDWKKLGDWKEIKQ